MNKILVISGHPDYKHSLANRAILDEFHKLVPEAEIVYLDSLYPDFRIDIAKEQQRLVGADTIVFEFPIYWYSAPSLLHRYFEGVLSYGFAFGQGGTALHGKKLIVSFTTGTAEKEYSPEGYQHYTIDQFMPQFRALASLCGFDYLGEIYSCGMTLIGKDDKATVDEFYGKTTAHARKLAERVK